MRCNVIHALPDLVQSATFNVGKSIRLLKGVVQFNVVRQMILYPIMEETCAIIFYGTMECKYTILYA